MFSLKFQSRVDWKTRPQAKASYMAALQELGNWAAKKQKERVLAARSRDGMHGGIIIQGTNTVGDLRATGDLHNAKYGAKVSELKKGKFRITLTIKQGTRRDKRRTVREKKKRMHNGDWPDWIQNPWFGFSSKKGGSEPNYNTLAKKHVDLFRKAIAQPGGRVIK